MSVWPGVHVNFTTPTDQEALEAAGFLRREDCRFLWRNAAYPDFEAFLARFRADKRKKLKRERRRVEEAGVTIETLGGEDVTAGSGTRSSPSPSERFCSMGTRTT